MSEWVAQGSAEWVKARVGHLTASDMADAMAYSAEKWALHVVGPDGELTRIGNGITAEKKAEAARKKGLEVRHLKYEDSTDLAPRIKLKKEIVAERMTGLASERFVTQAMQDGIEREPIARDLFEARSGLLVRPVGFILHRSIELFGASPDGRISKEEGFEAKCPTMGRFLDWLLAGVVPPEYQPQMTAQCVCAGFRRVHFVAFHPDMPNDRNLFHRVFEPTQEQRDVVEAEAIKLLSEVDALFERVTTTPMEELEAA